jgi:hypothetical protein
MNGAGLRRMNDEGEYSVDHPQYDICRRVLVIQGLVVPPSYALASSLAT